MIKTERNEYFNNNFNNIPKFSFINYSEPIININTSLNKPNPIYFQNNYLNSSNVNLNVNSLYKPKRITERKGVIITGLISSGKSTFINSLLGINCLETNDNITTKIICIIRYNPELIEPKFYQLKINEENKKYYFTQDSEEIIGIERIKKEIAEKNKDESNKNPRFDSLFYMLETNIINIQNKEFLLNHDFYDLPGINEFIQEETNLKKKYCSKKSKRKKRKKKEEVSYIHGIFKYIKHLISNQIIILNTENYTSLQNIKFIKELKNEIGIPFENSLIILNKIDKSPNPKKTIQDCKAFFTNNFDSSEFNINYNIFIPLDSKAFNNEMLMNHDYKNYFYYFYRKYLEENKINKCSFFDYLVKVIVKYDKNKLEYIQELAFEFDDNDYNIIKIVYNDLQKELNILRNEYVDFNEENDNTILILKAFYRTFIDKLIKPEYSENVTDILNYFNRFNNEEKLIENVKIKEEKKVERELSNKIIQLKDIYQQLMNILPFNQKDYLYKLENNFYYLQILNEDRINIPINGISSSGKSTILNCIIGFKLFPEAMDECTRRGIIIQYSQNIELYETEVNIENNIFNYSKKLILIAKGINQVKQHLISLNYEYRNENNKCFYIVKTPIQFLDDYIREYKYKISFIDLPGGDVIGNSFNQLNENGNNFYTGLFNISPSMIFVSKGRAIRSSENHLLLECYNNSILNKLYKDYNHNNSYLNICLFVVNMFDTLTEEERKIENIQKDFYDILFSQNDNDDDYKEINTTIFNAGSYQQYLVFRDLFFKIDDLFQQLKKDFLNQLYDSSYKLIKNFPKYCLKQIKQKIKMIYNDFNEIEKKFDDDIFFYNQIKEVISDLMKEMNLELKKSDEKIIKNIANLLKQIHLNIKSIQCYQKSFCEDFFKKLSKQIQSSAQYYNNLYKTIFLDTLNIFNQIFYIPRYFIYEKVFDFYYLLKEINELKKYYENIMMDD